MRPMPYVHAAASTIATRLGTEFVLLVALAAFVVHERRCTRGGTHGRCAVEVLGGIATGVLLVVGAVNALSSANSTPGTIDAGATRGPSVQAALVALLATFLSSVYGRRALWSWSLIVLCGGAQAFSGQVAPEHLAQGWLIGSGFALLLFAAVRLMRTSCNG